jgi:hypothetical protein
MFLLQLWVKRLFYPRDQDRSTIAYTVELVESHIEKWSAFERPIPSYRSVSLLDTRRSPTVQLNR